MDLAALLSELMPLLADPEANERRIVDLLARSERLPDSEVARFLAGRHLEPYVRRRLEDPDPAVRRAAVQLVHRTFGRQPAAKVLRVATKDRASQVRRAAFHATRSLLLDEVALPDTLSTRKVPPRRGINPFTKQEIVFAGYERKPRFGWFGARVGGFNPTGWRFGLYAVPGRTRRPQPAFQALRSADDVARLVGRASAAELKEWLRPGVGPGTPYVQFELPKASGGVRLIAAPRAELRRAQRTILRTLLEGLEPHTACHAFVKGRSTVTNAAPHVGARLVLKMDLVDFFRLFVESRGSRSARSGETSGVIPSTAFGRRVRPPRPSIAAAYGVLGPAQGRSLRSRRTAARWRESLTEASARRRNRPWRGRGTAEAARRGAARARDYVRNAA